MAIFLEKLDSVPLSDDDFSYTFNSWLSVMVDTANEDNERIQTHLNGNGDATFITRKTSTQITALIDRNSVPVLEVGALWMDTTIGKLKVLVTAAVPGISDGITETVTST